MSGRNLGEPMNKGQMMEQRLAAHYPMTMFTIDLRTGLHQRSSSMTPTG